VEQPPLRGVEVIEERNDVRISEPLIAEPLSDMGPVLLLHMGVIVLVVGPASGELDRVSSVGKVTQEMVVEKLRAVITIESPQGKGERLFNMMDLLKHPCLSFAPDGPLLTPSRGDIHAVNGIGEHTSEGRTAVGHGIGLQEPGAILIPLVGVDGYALSQEGSWFSGGPAPLLVGYSYWFEHSVDGGRGYGQQGIGGFRG